MVPRRVASWQRGRNFLTSNSKLSKTRDCQSIAGFLFLPGHPRGDERKANMNKIYQRVPARFAREIRFEIKPVPFRATQTTALDNLKERLLRGLLATVADPEQNTLLRRAANEAAALVWLEPFPLLLFPALLEEKAGEAVRRQARQGQIRLRSQNMFIKAAA